ncbi:hypothetical protein ACP4OV_014716 [Aristida adscensionis]
MAAAAERSPTIRYVPLPAAAPPPLDLEGPVAQSYRNMCAAGAGA